MSQYTIGQLKLDLSRDIAPAHPDDSRDINGAIAQAAEELLSEIKPKDLSKRAVIENALYDQVNRYTCPDDLDTDKIMEWYRLKNNQDVSTWFNPMTKVTNLAFSRANSKTDFSNPRNIFTIEYQSGKKFIKVSDTGGKSGFEIAKMNSVTEDGTWQTFGNVNNIAEDSVNYVAGSGSIRVDISDSSTTGGIQNFGITKANITEYLETGTAFTWLDIPNLNQIQTVTLALHSSPTDYYEVQVSSAHDTDVFQLGWNLLGFKLDRETMNTVGTPNPADINQIKITCDTNGTLNMDSVRIDNIVLRKGTAFGLQYISNRMFQNIDSGITQSRPIDDSDIILLEYDTYQVLRNYCANILAEELVSNQSDQNRFQTKRNDAIYTYKNKHKEEFIDETQTMRRFGVPYGNYNNSTSTHYHHDTTNE